MKRSRAEDIYPLELFVNPKEIHNLDLICAICHNVTKEPVVTKCSHVFCKVCLQTALQHNRVCPLCRRENPCANLAVNPFALRLVNKQIIHCPLAMRYNITDKCDWTGSISDSHTHPCPLRKVTCLECMVRVFKYEYDKKHCHITATTVPMNRPLDLQEKSNLADSVFASLRNNNDYIKQIVRESNYEMVTFMLKMGLNPNTLCDYNSILMFATVIGDIRIVYEILSAKADPNLQAPYLKYTALHFAVVDEEDIEIVRILLEFKADPWIENEHHISPLEMAHPTTHEMMIQLIKEKETSRHGSTPVEPATNQEETL